MTAPDLKFLKPVDLKRSTVTDAGRLSGYGSVFGNEDLGGDVVAPGAFAKSLDRRGASGVRMLWQHDASQPIGVWTEIREDQRGLYLEGDLTLETQKGREAHALLKAGALNGLSIGFQLIADEVDRQTGVRTIRQADLWEVSLVTFPMNPDATVTGVKSIATKTDLERALRDAGFSRNQAKKITAGGWPALRNADQADRDAAAAIVETIKKRARALAT